MKKYWFSLGGKDLPWDRKNTQSALISVRCPGVLFLCAYRTEKK